MKTIKILNNLPWLDCREEGNLIFVRINPKIYGADKYYWFGVMVIEEIKLLNRELSDILKDRLWNVEEKRGKGKRYFFLTPVASCEKRKPDCYWIGVTRPTNYPEGKVKIVMKGLSFRKERYEGTLLALERMGKVLEINNDVREKIRITQIAQNGAKIILTNQHLEKMGCLLQ